MDIMDLVSKGIVKIVKSYGKKVCKTKVAEPIEKVMPTVIKGDGYNVGFSTAEIMPDLTKDTTYWIAGHGSGHKMEGILSPVYTSAVWIDCGNDEGMLWIGADIVGMTNIETMKVRSMLADFAKEVGCKCINISTTHSHSGIDTLGYWGKPFASIPSDGKDPDYMNMLMETMVKVSKEAYANRKAGKLYLGTKYLEGAQQTGRATKGLNETLTRLRFAPADGSAETWIMNFSAHPNSLGGGNRMLSGEYPYFMREHIKEACGANVLFGIGAIGGIDMADYDENDNVNNIKIQGKVLAEGALAIDNDKELEPEMKIVQQKFYLPIDNNVLMLLGMRQTFSNDPYPSKESELGVALKSEMTYMEIGSQKILLLPGEMFQSAVFGGYDEAEISSTGLGPEVNPTPLVEVANDPNLVVFGVSNDMTGYCVPPNDFVLNQTQPYLNTARDRFDRRHYHETNSMGPNTQRVIKETFEDILSRV
ncbi:MAG: hypothetical protein J6L91_05390 [Clostridia bacterium]|nr:hypothetical protein [Clostridia bacterium]